MTEANIVLLIDLQNGFADKNVTVKQGGSLYVPDGEKAPPLAGDLIGSARDTIFILSQDFHPADHISFATNHKGVEPFSFIYVRPDLKGQFRAAAAEIGDAIHAVDTDEHGYITKVRDETLDPKAVSNDLKLQLWLNHCVQGTFSSEFSPSVMVQLPSQLRSQLKKDLTSQVLKATDDRGNQFFVVRKGLRSDLHSYGIATEDDGLTTTEAPALFKSVARELHDKGVTGAQISIGGLATNYCVEFSHKDVWKYLVPALKEKHIVSDVHLLTDISYGIPVPGLECAFTRMAKMGSGLTTTHSLMKANRAFFPQPA